MKIYINKYQSGFGLVEVIVAVAIFTIIAATGTMAVLGSFSTNRLGDEETEATLLAQEGIEAARSIRNQAWSYPFLGTDCSSGCGVDSTTGKWIWDGSNDIFGKFTRTVTVTQAQRDGSGNIVDSGGTLDDDTYKVTSTVDWNFVPTRNNSVELITYLTNFIKSGGNSWATLVQESSIDFPNNDDGWKVMVSGNYAYAVRRSGTPDFIVVDISNSASPFIAASLDLGGGQGNIFIAGNYAYVPSDENSSELKIINISTPSSPSQVGSYNAPGNDDGLGVQTVGSYAYLTTRKDNNNDEIFVVNVSNPSSPSLAGSTELSHDANEIVVLGNYAYIASSTNAQELQIVNISTPSNPSLVASYDFSGNNDSETIAGSGSTVIIGRANGDLSIFDVSTPTSPSLQNSTAFSAQGMIRDILYDSDGSRVFIGTDYNFGEMQVVDISTPSSPVLLSLFDFAGQNISGIDFNLDEDRVFAVTDLNSQEFIVIMSGP